MINEKKKKNDDGEGVRGRGRGRGKGERGRGRGGRGGGHRDDAPPESSMQEIQNPEEKLMAILSHLSDFIKMKLDKK
jgi:hypothetical protein